MLIIGLNGRKQTGKDTFATFAEEIMPGQVGRISFAHPLKAFCANYLGVSEENLFGSDDEKNEELGTWGQFFDNVELIARYGKSPESPVSGREILQVVGTDIFRENLKESIWVDIAQRRLETRQFDAPVPDVTKVKLVCITDVRFPNEVAWLSEQGHKLVRINRYTGKRDSIAHASETVFDSIDESLFDEIIEPQENKSLKQARQNAIRILNNFGLLDTVCD